MDEKLKEALERVLKAPDTGFIPYAKTYANAALRNPYTGTEMEGHELKVQLLYVSSNLQYWRGEEARGVKETLKLYSK